MPDMQSGQLTARRRLESESPHRRKLSALSPQKSLKIFSGEVLSLGTTSHLARGEQSPASPHHSESDVSDSVPIMKLPQLPPWQSATKMNIGSHDEKSEVEQLAHLGVQIPRGADAPTPGWILPGGGQARGSNFVFSFTSMFIRLSATFRQLWIAPGSTPVWELREEETVVAQESNRA
ncbi:hypothetical protein CYMTET_4314 [Cymbomonas tetramitiformis]|nr:hypothetical protein CYMTET_4314 [Cymbomonas tetramitiformis]